MTSFRYLFFNAFISGFKYFQPISIQKKMIEEAIVNWQGDNEQTDDVTLFGIEI